MTKDELIAETAMRLFVKEFDRDVNSQTIRATAGDCWMAAAIFANSRPTVGRNPITPIHDTPGMG